MNNTFSSLVSSTTPASKTDAAIALPVSSSAAGSVAGRTYKAAPSSINKKVWNTVKKIFTALVAIGLYIVNPSIFVGGFLVGIVASDKVCECTEKIARVWNSQPFTSAFLLGFAAFLALPVALGAASALFAAHLGSKMEEESRLSIG